METDFQQKRIDNHCLGDKVRQHTEQVMKLRHKLHLTSCDSEQLVATLKQSLEQKDEEIKSKEWVLQEKKRQIKQLQQSLSDKKESSTSAQALRLQWKSTCRSKALLKTSSAVDGGIAYLYSWWEGKIMMYNSETMWALLPECPKISFSIAVVNGLLTAIGG